MFFLLIRELYIKGINKVAREFLKEGLFKKNSF